jgi:hypothetical protein
MNTSKFSTMGCALLMTTATFNATALTTKAGIDICTKAMVNELSTELGAPVGYTMDSILRDHVRMKRTETFHLDARDPGTDEIVGRYDCVVNNKAEVIKLVMLPLSADDAKTRAWKTK